MRFKHRVQDHGLAGLKANGVVVNFAELSDLGVAIKHALRDVPQSAVVQRNVFFFPFECGQHLRQRNGRARKLNLGVQIKPIVLTTNGRRHARRNSQWFAFPQHLPAKRRQRTGQWHKVIGSNPKTSIGRIFSRFDWNASI